MLNESYKIIDISQPVNSKSACFPGDVPFSKNSTLTYKDSGIVNLTAFTMSPHVGTHADAPNHMKGELMDAGGTAGELPLNYFIGPVTVIDLAPHKTGIEPDDIFKFIERGKKFPERILFKTRHQIRYDKFEDDYSYISCELAEVLSEQSVKLIGLDTPSVDHVDSKTLSAHGILLKGGLVWLENLDLSKVDAGNYQLIALPLRMEELEASPVRAVLLV